MGVLWIHWSGGAWFGARHGSRLRQLPLGIAHDPVQLTLKPLDFELERFDLVLRIVHRLLGLLDTRLACLSQLRNTAFANHPA